MAAWSPTVCVVEKHNGYAADRSIGLDESIQPAVAGRHTGQWSAVIRLLYGSTLTGVSSDADDRGYEYQARTRSLVARHHAWEYLTYVNWGLREWTTGT